MNRIFPALVVALTLMLPGAAMASTVNLSPTTVSVTPGKVFTVTVTANPANTKVYTVRADVSFDPALVTASSFTFAPKWLSPGANKSTAINNTAGSVTETAAYIGGITAPTVFGTITFKAKKTGTVHISATTKSLLLDGNSKNTISGTQGSSVVVIKKLASKVKKVTPKAKVKAKAHNTSSVQKSVPAVQALVATTTESTSTAPLTATSTAAAAAAGAGTSGVNWLLLALALIAVIGGGIWYSRRTKIVHPPLQ